MKIALKNKIATLKEKFLESIENENQSINSINEEVKEEKFKEKHNEKSKKLKNEKIKKTVENEIGSDNNNNDKRIFLTVPVTLNICSDISALALGKKESIMI